MIIKFFISLVPQSFNSSSIKLGALFQHQDPISEMKREDHRSADFNAILLLYFSNKTGASSHFNKAKELRALLLTALSLHLEASAVYNSNDNAGNIAAALRSKVHKLRPAKVCSFFALACV